MKLLPIEEIATKINLSSDYLTSHGKYAAKINLKSIDPIAKQGKLILVTSTTPTPQGEGKTVTTIGISEALNYIGEKAIACIRQPSLGPVFGQKGGAAGGGQAEVVPMEQLNLHLTGDIHALTSAHNLASAALDARLFHENRLRDRFTEKSGLPRLNIDKNAIVWPRVVDHNDRALRDIYVGKMAENLENVHPAAFDITAASELMAILALSKNLQDLRQRIGKVVLAYDMNGREITAEDLEVAGAMTAILQKAIEPTLMQTTENTPVIVHAGPFANIAHGNSSIIADDIALSLADYVVTEAGFGSDMGMEKFFNIKARTSGVFPSCIVVVSTVKSIKANCVTDNPTAIEMLECGARNLGWHIHNAKRYGLPVIVAINAFPNDTVEELAFIRSFALENGAVDCEISNAYAEGGKGASILAEKIVKACESDQKAQLLYGDDLNLQEKIFAVASTYGATEVDYSPEAMAILQKLEAEGYGNLPVCIAKTPASISHDPKIKNVPAPFILPVKTLQLAKGAGFIKVLLGDVMTMPGLGLNPAYRNIDIDEDGNIVGL
ncbi:formate--tetrahydrofolate ligase [Wohlfahrtiimonas larvae]|uniref:Formate--tetrahydrofolate ligase n=1 Tax=Wohlfahrtiimonas larvae TaxID=1157986 RepID=A0ABP9MFG8_9GAMM|nr:formate--tetrahydrofolate ligase [Wohlfahrtiimonas larvae]